MIKTFQFTEEEKITILTYLMSHRMNRLDIYDDSRWEKVRKQRNRIKKEIKGLTGYMKNVTIIKSLDKLNFDELTNGRLGFEEDQFIHIPNDPNHLNEEITNLLRKLINPRAKYVW